MTGRGIELEGGGGVTLDNRINQRGFLFKFIINYLIGKTCRVLTGSTTVRHCMAPATSQLVLAVMNFVSYHVRWSSDCIYS
jgi:hypothetical protein